MAGFTSYDAVGLAEDVQDDIYMISPVDNPGNSMASTPPATARQHEWQEDALAAIKKNANVEGAAAGTDTSAPTVLRLANCQIFSEIAEITRTEERVKKYGRGSEMSYQIMKRYMDLLRDEESACWGDAGGDGRQTGVVGDNSTARELTSIYTQCDTSTYKYATDDELVTGVAITTTEELEGVLLSAIQAQFDNGGNCDYILTDSSTAGYFPSFALSAGRQREFVGSTLYNKIDIYVSQWGTLDVVIDRSMTNAAAKAMCIVDFDLVMTPVLESTHDYPIAKLGDSDRRQVIRESTFAIGNQKGIAIVDAIPGGLTPPA